MAGKVNHKKVHGIYREEGSTVRKRKSRRRAKASLAHPWPPKQRWSLDFMSHIYESGRRTQTLKVIEDFNHEYLARVVAAPLIGKRVAREFDKIAEMLSLPSRVILDNGTKQASNENFK